MPDELRRYYAPNRPDYFPAGHAALSTWWQAELIPGCDLSAHGWAEYAARLTFAQIRKFELRPADQVELAEYAFWQYGNYDRDEGWRLLLDYLDQSLEFLAQCAARHDRMAEWALILKQANYPAGPDAPRLMVELN
ncbi:MAG: hypothetical protein IPO08_22740 [Xanthomonadales bacterium]|nr:hypothetical protein [Xanthomonadales bacterium]